MQNLQFEIRWHRPSARWRVRRGGDVCGEYPSKQEAIRTAVDAAKQAMKAGYDAQVVDGATAARIF
jgi:uncharacterized protein DUF2188